MEILENLCQVNEYLRELITNNGNALWKTKTKKHTSVYVYVYVYIYIFEYHEIQGVIFSPKAKNNLRQVTRPQKGWCVSWNPTKVLCVKNWRVRRPHQALHAHTINERQRTCRKTYATEAYPSMELSISQCKLFSTKLHSLGTRSLLQVHNAFIHGLKNTNASYSRP